MIPVLRDLERDARGAMKYIVKDFPLDSTCNWKLLRPKHLGACEAAVAMRIAAEVGVAQPLAQWIEANQRNLTTESVDEQVRLLGFGPALRDGRYRAALAVKRDIGDGLALGVRSTPTFFINGVRVEGVLPPVQFRKVVGEAMRIADSRSHPAR
jgi:hypothetical protein